MVDPTRLGSRELIDEFKVESRSGRFKESIDRKVHAPTAMLTTPLRPTRMATIRATLLFSVERFN